LYELFRGRAQSSWQWESGEREASEYHSSRKCALRFSTPAPRAEIAEFAWIELQPVHAELRRLSARP